MKKSIFKEVLGAFLFLCLIFFTIIALLIPVALRRFFTDEAYQAIAVSQEVFILSLEDSSPNYDFFGNPLENNVRAVNHMLYHNGKLYVADFPNVALGEEMMKNGFSQKSDVQKYHAKSESGDIFYIIRLTDTGFILSYLSESYIDNLTLSLYKSLVILLAAAAILSIVPAFFLSKKITSPILTLIKKVDILREGNWDEVITDERKDEIGSLAKSVEHFRVELIKKNEAEREFLQNVSHELKTPVMVIESYAEAIKDEIYPKGSLISSLETISEETEKLKAKIENLLMINRLRYFEGKSQTKVEFEMCNLIKKILEKFSLQKPDLVLDLKLEEWTLFSNLEAWEAAIENLVDNQFRFAKSVIKIESKDGFIKIQNDGPPLSSDFLPHAFEKFKKGDGGHFGLGLSIVKSVAESSGFSVIAINEENKATFILRRLLV